MARKPRIHYPGAFYHVILRGNAGNDVFFKNHDRSRFFLLVQEGVERFRHRIHAYCLMTNHIHLLIQVKEIPLSRIIQNLSFRYTRYINSSRKQTGHLFQGRYKALLLDADNYLQQLVRYIHNNPVRARIVTHPDKYEWSSHTDYLGTTNHPWLTTVYVLKQFAETETRARKLYNQFQQQGLNEQHKPEFQQGTAQGRILGDDRFVDTVLNKTSQRSPRKVSLKDILNVVCKHYECEQIDLSSKSKSRPITEARAVAALLVRESDDHSLTELSRGIHRDLSTLSQAAARFERRMRKDSSLSEKINELKKQLE